MADDIVKRLRKTREPLNREAAREIVKLRGLLERASEVIPDYMDGRNDKLLDAIDRALPSLVDAQ